MKLLITGATGFIGKELLPLLRDQGHEMIVLTRNPEKARVRLSAACRVESWNPATGGFDETLLSGVDGVVHLAGEGVASGRWNEARKRAIYESRIASTRGLMQAVARMPKPPAVFVSASAIGIYGDCGEELLDETSAAGSGFLADVCRDWETEVFREGVESMRRVALRIGVVLGNGGGAMEKMLPPFKLGLGGTLGGGAQWMSWIHVRDVAGLIVHALETPALSGPVNAAAPHPATNRDFTRVLAGVLNRPAFLPVPGFVLKTAFGEMSQILLNSQRVSADKAKASGYKFRYPQLETALKVVCERPGHDLVTEIWVPEARDKVFEFFSDARNLEKLTPPFLKFRILRITPESMGTGTLLDYRLSLHGIPVRWQSKITDWEPGTRFCDLQTRGPYAYWHHTHEFVDAKGGTLIRDRVQYRLPFGVPGDVVAHPLVRKDLETIFSYRMNVIDRMYPSDPKA